MYRVWAKFDQTSACLALKIDCSPGASERPSPLQLDLASRTAVTPVSPPLPHQLVRHPAQKQFVAFFFFCTDESLKFSPSSHMATSDGGGGWRDRPEQSAEARDAALAMMAEGLATAFQCLEDGMADKLESLGKEQSALLAKLQAAREVCGVFCVLRGVFVHSFHPSTPSTLKCPCRFTIRSIRERERSSVASNPETDRDPQHRKYAITQIE